DVVPHQRNIKPRRTNHALDGEVPRAPNCDLRNVPVANLFRNQVPEIPRYAAHKQDATLLSVSSPLAQTYHTVPQIRGSATRKTPVLGIIAETRVWTRSAGIGTSDRLP